MPRSKRPLSQVDPNLPGTAGPQKKSKNASKLIHASPDCPVKKAEEKGSANKQGNKKYVMTKANPKPKAQPKAQSGRYPSKKDPKLIHTNPHCPIKTAEEEEVAKTENQKKGTATKGSKTTEQKEKKHPKVDVSIAERFEKRGFGTFRLIETYPDLQMSEMKELLQERDLKISGKKAELVDRLEEWDEEHPSGGTKVGDKEREALARQPVPIGAKASEMGPKEEDPVEKIIKRGPRGPPVYDEMGFELDYNLCAGGPVSKQAILNASERSVDRMERETKIKARIMGMKIKENSSPFIEEAWNDRVSKDLGIPYHKVGAAQFEEWKKKGFKADPKEFQNISEEDEERLDLLTTGCSLRKGSVH